MIGELMPNPRDTIIVNLNLNLNLNLQLDQFFAAGGKVEPAATFKSQHRKNVSRKLEQD